MMSGVVREEDEKQRADEDTYSPTLDDDLLTQILLRLPPKSVTTLKLVSKSWLSLISANPHLLSFSPTRQMTRSALRNANYFTTSSRFKIKRARWRNGGR
ncbi:hypothetical protein ACS0TY_000864 [Phlomoides rotata]